MKHLKSSVRDLRRMFESTITIRDIAEPLVSFDGEHKANDVRVLMEKRGFDVLGVREHGVIVGYVRREELVDGLVTDHQVRFDAGDVRADTDPLISVFESLREKNAVFIRVFGQIGGIVTRGDLQKAPVRMWMFGLISLIEMQLERVIREKLPEATWMALLTENRLAVAKRLFEERKRRNEEIDLGDCLQLGDKGRVFIKDGELFQIIDFKSKTVAEKFFDDAQRLRDRLAHAQDIIKGSWPDVADLLIEAERVLGRLEKKMFTSGS